MKIQIVGKNIEVTQALHSYVSTKISDAIKHFSDIKEVTVSLLIEHLEHTVEVNIKINNKNIHCKHSEKDLYKSIDVISNKLEKLLHKEKDKKSSISHHSAKKENADL